jgi:hypothetical protein
MVLGSRRMRTPLACFLIGAALAACSGDNGNRPPGATLTVENHSDFAIVDVRVSPVGADDFGPNLLGADVLQPGEDLTLGVTCDTFDVQVTDETGAVCMLDAIDLCLNDATLVLTNTACPVFSGSKRAP